VGTVPDYEQSVITHLHNLTFIDLRILITQSSVFEAPPKHLTLHEIRVGIIRQVSDVVPKECHIEDLLRICRQWLPLDMCCLSYWRRINFRRISKHTLLLSMDEDSKDISLNELGSAYAHRLRERSF
jgi:hypothetical protein